MLSLDKQTNSRTAGLRGRLARWLAGPPQPPRPIRAERMYAPAVRSLEPRFVLNATAEWSFLADSLIDQASLTSAAVTTDTTIASEGVTLISRSADNLEIRTGDQLSTALAATPVIKSIASLNAGSLNVIGTATTDDLLMIDVDQFVDPGGISFEGLIEFAGGRGVGQDQLSLLDSNPSTDDSFQRLSYKFLIGASRTGEIIADSGVAPSSFELRFTEVELIDQLVDTNRLEIEATFRPDRFTIENATSPGLNQISTVIDDQSGPLLTITNPRESFLIQNLENDDEVVINSVDDDFHAAVEIDGQEGNDDIVIAGDLLLGSGSVPGDLDLRAESIQILGSIDTTAGNPDGTVTFAADSIVNVSGSIDTGTSDVVVTNGARLEGGGNIVADVVVENGGSVGSIRVGSLEFRNDGQLQVQIDGPEAGVDYDQVVINPADGVDGAVTINGGLLDLSFGFAPAPSSEFVLIDNDGTDNINGRFRTFLDTDGTLLAVSRELDEGDVVLDTSSGIAESAYITYFGGDGNDVAIVTGGDLTVTSQGVTIISRQGTNLEIHIGDTVANALAASPIVRQIAGFAGNQLRIEGTAAIDDQLFIDVDRLIDPTGINFAGTIVFAGNEGLADEDKLVVFDSDLSTNDSADAISFASLALPEAGVMIVDLQGNAPDIDIQYSGTEFVDQLIGAREISMTMSVRAETLLIDRDPVSPNLNQIQTIVDTTPGTVFTTINPTEQFSIFTGSGNDNIQFNGISSSFSAALQVIGTDGLNTITVATPLTLGNAGVTGNVHLSADVIQIVESISTTNGVTDGSVLLEGSSEIVIGAATISSGDAPILIDGNDGTIDTAAGTIRSFDSVTIRDASSVLLGSVLTSGGTLTLGFDRDISGPVTQAGGSSIIARRLTASTNSSIELSDPSNQFQVLDRIIASGAITIADGAGNLQLIGIDSGGNDITVSTVGTAVLETAIQSPGASVQIDAGQAIRDFDPADTTAKIIADTVILTAGSGGIGQTGALEVNANVLSVDTSAGDGSVHITNPFGGLEIDQVNAGNGVVRISADQIDDAAADTLTDFTASRLVLEAESGIGSLRPLELFSLQRLSAATDSGGINLDWTATGNTVVEQLVAGSGGIVLTQRGAQTLDIEILENLSGPVNILSQDGSIDIAAGSLISADTIRIDAARDLSIDRSIQTTGGGLTLQSGQSLLLLGSLDTSAVGAAGVILVTSPSLTFNNAQLTSEGAMITVVGNLIVDGEVRIDSGNAQTATRAGNIEFRQAISGADAAGDRLVIDARGSDLNGNVTVGGPVGEVGGILAARDLNGLDVHGNIITIDSIGVTSGDIQLSGSEVRLTGNRLRTSGSGDLQVNAPLVLPEGGIAITAAGSVLFRNDVTGVANTGILDITAGEDFIVDGAIGTLAGLVGEASGTTRLFSSVQVAGDITLSGQIIELFSPSIEASGNVVFANDVAFKAESQLDANQVRFDGVVSVDPLRTTEVTASVVDSPIATELVKLGDGTLVLIGSSPLTQDTRVTAGTLRLFGIFGAAASNIVVANGARLEGDAVSESNLAVESNGTVGPGTISTASGDDTASLVVSSLQLAANSTFEVALDGAVAGSDFDQIVINANDAADGSVMLDGSLLDFSLGFVPGADTEFVLIDNDGTDAIDGRFRTLFGTDGSLLPVARSLEEGGVVFDTTIGTAESAYITYFGGDGNDVAIVVGGDHTVQSQGVTLVSRRGSNLEIRVGDSLAAAQAASPTVRPIAGLNGNQLRIEGSSGDDQLFIDFDQFVNPHSINFDGAIVFTGQNGGADQDRLVVFDSDLQTEDAVDSVTYQSLAARSGVINISAEGNLPKVLIEFSGSEIVDQLIDAGQIQLLTSDLGETLIIDRDSASPNLNEIQTLVGSAEGTVFTIPGARQKFSILGGSGDDTFSFNGIGDGFSAALEVIGDGGSDRLTIATPMTLGSAAVTGDLLLSAESVQISDSISTTGGATDGTVMIDGGSEIVIGPGTVSSGTAPILIDGNGGRIDTTTGTLDSLDSVLIRDAAAVILGNVDSPAGTLTLGVDRDITGSVTQATGTSVVAGRLNGSTNGFIDLSNSANEFAELDALSNGEISISDSSGDLRLIRVDSGDNDITISTVGTALLASAIQSPGSVIQIDAGQAIRDFDSADTTAKITADMVKLTAGGGGIGQDGAFEISADVLTIDTSSGDGNVNVANPFGNLRIDQVNAGSGVVQVSAVQIDDAGNDSFADFTASRLVLNAQTGIGRAGALELLDVARLSARTDSGGISLDWATFGDTVIEELIAGSGGIMLTQRGADTLDIQVLENPSGVVNIVSVDGAIDIAAGPLITADNLRIQAHRALSIERSISTSGGPLMLGSDDSIVLSGDLATTAAGSTGVITISAPQIQWNDAELTTAGADITVAGDLTIDGQVRVDSGNQQSATQAGHVEFSGTISGTDATGDLLLIDARGSARNGNATIGGAIGATAGIAGNRDINALEIHADAITLVSAGATRGDIRFSGSAVVLTGGQLRTSVAGEIEVDAPLRVLATNVTIDAADSVLIRDRLTGVNNTSDVTITAGQDIVIGGVSDGLADLIIDAADTTRLFAALDVSGNVTLDGQVIELFLPSVTTQGNVVFANDVQFKTESRVDANQVRFDGSVTVDPQFRTEITGAVIDSPVVSQLLKDGGGTLILSSDSPFSQNTRVAAGTLRVLGRFGSAAGDLVVGNGARLEGNGRIGADVIVQEDGEFGPGISETNGDIDSTLFTDSLALLAGSRFDVQINGPLVGVDTDQVVVSSADMSAGTVNVNGALLDATVAFIPAESTEFVVIDNDGVDDVLGRFAGTDEGRIIFGSEDSPGPRAYITYFGGDGNDVSIVTAGNLTIDSEGVIVVSRRGTNLEIRTADTFAGALLADPEIRPIGALNGNELRIIGQPSDDALFVDVDRFIDPNPQGVNYNGTIVFTAQESPDLADQDQLILFDSDPASDDSLQQITYGFSSLDDGLITVDPRLSDEFFQVQFSDVELIDQPIDAARLAITTSDLPEQISVAESAGLIPIQVTSGGVSGTQLSIPTPRDSFTFNAGGGDDTLQVNNLTDVRSEVLIRGGAGVDSLTLATSLSLGQGNITGNLELSAETLRIQNSVDTTGGDTDGNVLLSGGTIVTFDSGAAIFSGNATITIDGNGGIIDATGGFVRSRSAGDAVVIQDAGSVTLSGVEAPNGTTVIGIAGDITGPVSQAAGVNLITDRLSISTNAAVDLSSPANEIRIVDADQRGGPISITDAVGDLTLSGLNSAGESVQIIAAGPVLLDNDAINADAASVSISAASIDDLNPADGRFNISAGSIALIAPGGVGRLGPVNVNAGQSVSADTSAAGGDVRLANPQGLLPIGAIDAGTGRVELTGLQIEDAGDDTVVDITASRLEMRAANGIGTDGALEITNTDGAIELFADAGAGTADITAQGDVTIENVVTSNQSAAAARIVARSGAIISGNQALDIDVADGTVTLISDFGIGFGDPLQTAIAALNAESVNTGGIEIQEVDDIQLASLITGDGLIEVNAGGSITALNVISTNPNGLDDASAAGDDNRRDITLIAQSPQHDILVENVSALNSADVFLIAADDVLDLDSANDRRVVADDLRVISGNDSADQLAAVKLSTNVEDLEVLVMSEHRGDIEIRESDGIRLAASDRIDDAERIETSNGEIRIFAGESIRILDPDPSNESFERTADVEIIAAGDHGRIVMRSGDLLEIGNAAQVNAEQFNIDAVVLESDGIVFGEQIEINTGGGVGVARVFSPRPTLDFGGTAFFDFTSVRTNRLEQALINDAEGILTLDIGNQGERGLTINIDWGTPFQRFQQIDGLSGDAPPLSVKHLYLEGDILDTRLNDRASGTAPINVKFAVRHHESILVLGDTVVQAAGDVATVAGGVVSTTDNPLTFESEDVQILENGETQFIIPNLSIPVAFFPVRNVIPETEQPEILIVQEQIVAFTTATLETVEASVSTSVSREEYFQIRALSPDLRQGDLATPERLPDDILDGDKLRTLFSKLPDGRYAIEYVLGDGNERSILTVDLRNGKPIIPGGELDGGILRLRILNGDSIDLDLGEGAEEATEKLEGQAPVEDQTAGPMPPADVASQDRDPPMIETAALFAFTAHRRYGQRMNRDRESNRFSAAKRMISRIKRRPTDSSPAAANSQVD